MDASNNRDFAHEEAEHRAYLAWVDEQGRQRVASMSMDTRSAHLTQLEAAVVEAQRVLDNATVARDVFRKRLAEADRTVEQVKRRERLCRGYAGKHR